MNRTKEELRDSIKHKLKSLSAEFIQSQSLLLCERLKLELLSQTALKQRKTILAWSKLFIGEVDLTSLCSKLKEKGYALFYPEIQVTGEMYFVSEVKKIYDASFDAQQTIILLPGLAFDLTGARLGRGKGHYDKFLSEKFLSNPEFKNVPKIGTCLEIQLIESVPIETHDVRVDYLAHEKAFIKVKK